MMWIGKRTPSIHIICQSLMNRFSLHRTLDYVTDRCTFTGSVDDEWSVRHASSVRPWDCGLSTELPGLLLSGSVVAWRSLCALWSRR